MKPRDMIRRRLDEEGNSIIAVILAWAGPALIAFIAWLFARGQEAKEKRRNNRSGGGAGQQHQHDHHWDDGDDDGDDVMDSRFIKQSGNTLMKENTSTDDEIFGNVSDQMLDNFLNDAQQVKTAAQAIAFVKKYSSLFTAKVVSLFKSSR